MKYDLIIRHGNVVHADGVRAEDLAIANGKIVEIAPEISGDARETIDATGLHIFPGLIDSHVHFNEPGRTDWEGFATGSSALVAGGGTCFFDMPLNSSPPVLDGKSFDRKREAGEKSSVADFGIWGGLTPKNLDRMEELAERGVVGFKAFMCPSGIDEFAYADDETLVAGMKIAAKHGLLVAVHAEYPLALDQARAKVTGHSWADYLASRPPECEWVATRIAIECAKEAGCALHIVHASHPHVVNTVSFSRERGADVTCETCPHYFLLTEQDLPVIGARAKCSPPLRSQDAADRLLVALHSKEIDFVASDHSPALPSMKTGEDAFAIWGGIAGVQSTLSALLTRWMDRSWPMKDLPPLIAGNVAKRYRIPTKGAILVGMDADLALVDSNQRFVLTRETLKDRHKLSPYVGRTFHGVVMRTIVRGRTVFKYPNVAATGGGKLVVPSLF